MTTYTAIPDADIDTDSPITQSLMTLMRDNPIAVTEGASGAPRIVRGAFDSTVLHKWFYDYGDESDGALSSAGSGAGDTTLDPGLYQHTTFQISAGDTFDLSGPGPLVICATTSITINGTLDVDGMGAQGATGLIGRSGIFGGSGGGSDSAGGSTAGGSTFLTDGGAVNSAGNAQSANTQALLLATVPMVLFSPTSSSGNIHCGGGSGGGISSYSGGHGGGLVILCAPTIVVGSAGIITADGTSGSYGGGGGGGAIIIATPSSGYTLTGGGSVAASGGASSFGGAGGAGIAPTGSTPTVTL